jgi:hypothetical protein
MAAYFSRGAVPDADDRASPGSSILGIATGLSPQDLARFGRDLFGKRIL